MSRHAHRTPPTAMFDSGPLPFRSFDWLQDPADDSANDHRPELLLSVEATSRRIDDGQWRFELQRAGEVIFAAHDAEPGDINRLTLLAAVRGLESIDGPSRLTLLSTNRYLIRSMTESLPRWRRSDFTWEQFGCTSDVQNADLWRRVDAAVRIHRVRASLLSIREVPPADLPSVARPREPDQSLTRLDAAHRLGGPTIRMRRRRGTSVDQPRAAGHRVTA